MNPKPELGFVLSTDTAQLPKRATELSSGFDLRYDGETFVLNPGERALVQTGLILGFLTSGYELQIRSRSGMTYKKGIVVANSPGTIDADYRGGIGVILLNIGNQPVEISPGDRVAQGVVAPVSLIDPYKSVAVTDTERGQGGFGSTGHF